MAGQKWPFVPAEESLPELTTRAIILGIFLGVVMTAANAYLGMKVGMTVSASIPAAVMSMLLLRGLRFENVSILENNIVQTMASAGESLAAGIIFTVPALLVMGIWDDIDPLQTFIIAFLGGVLGTMFTIALRRVFIVEEALPYPEGVACTEVLIAGEKGGTGLIAIIYALIIGAMYGWIVEGLKVTKKGVHTVGEFMGTKFYAGSEMSLALLSVGYIVGLRIASFIFIGGILGFGFLVPIFGLLHGFPSEPQGWNSAINGEWHGGPSYYSVWSSQVRYIGAGAMVIGGVWTLWSMRNTIFTGFGKALNFNSIDGEELLRTEKDTDMRIVLGVCGVILGLSFLFFFWKLGISLAIAGTLFIAAVAFFFSAVAGYIAGVVRSSNSPVSGMTIATLMFTAALVYVVGTIIGADNSTMMFSTLIIAAVVAVNAAIAGDVMQDLKTGHMVGATPWRQQIAETIGVIVGASVIGPILLLLNRAFKITRTHCEASNVKIIEESQLTGTLPDLYNCDEALLAPQADLIGTIIESIFGGSPNVEMLILGGLIAALLVWRKLPVMSVAIGIYLPLELSVPIFAGGLIHYYVTNTAILRVDGEITEKPTKPALKAAEEVTSRGVLIGAGFIAGESLVGVFIALLIVTVGDPSNWFNIPQLGQFPTLVFFLWFVGVFIFLTTLSLPKKLISLGQELMMIINQSLMRIYNNLVTKK
mgnify:CR=1 FL=1